MYLNNRNLYISTLRKYPLLNDIKLAYLAGFIDADGSISAQIKARKKGLKYKLEGFLAFHQKLRRGQWLFPLIKQHFNDVGYICDKKNGKMEYVMASQEEVKEALILLYPFFHLKKRQAKYVLDIICNLDSSRNNAAKFLSLCRKADRCSSLNDSKKRKVTSRTVLSTFKKAGLIK